MAVSDSYREYVLDQLGRTMPVRARRMFGELGLYSGERFFAIVADDVLYLKVDDLTRGKFEARGMKPFTPEGMAPMQYYEVPEEVIEEPDELGRWARDAVAVAERAAAKKRRRS